MRLKNMLCSFLLSLGIIFSFNSLIVYAEEPTGDKVYSYTGQLEEWVCPKTGEYQFTLIGGQGGGMVYNPQLGQWIQGGAGGKTVLNLKVKEGETLYINVGGAGHWEVGGYNGGGTSTNGFGGGGATTVAKRIVGSGELKDYISNYNILGVAGGGGGLANDWVTEKEWVNPEFTEDVYILVEDEYEIIPDSYLSCENIYTYDEINDEYYNASWEEKTSGALYYVINDTIQEELKYNFITDDIYYLIDDEYVLIEDKGYYDIIETEYTNLTNHGAPGNTEIEDTDESLIGIGQDGNNGGAGGSGLNGGYASSNITWEFVYRTSIWKYIERLEDYLFDRGIELPEESSDAEIYESRLLQVYSDNLIVINNYLRDYHEALINKDSDTMWKIYTEYFDREGEWKDSIYGSIDKFNPKTGSGGTGYALNGTIDKIYSTGSISSHDDYTIYYDENIKPVEKDGSCTVKFLGEKSVKLSINVGDDGRYPGYTGNAVVELEPYEPYTLLNAVPNADIEFKGYAPIDMYNTTLPLKHQGSQVQYDQDGVAITLNGGKFTGGVEIIPTWEDESIEVVWLDTKSVGGVNRVAEYTYKGHVW